MRFNKLILCLVAALLITGCPSITSFAAENDEEFEVVSLSRDAKEDKEDEEVTYTKAQVRLLASLIYCESSNQPYAGKLAVGIVVMNRVRSGKYPDTLKGVIYQRYQFGPARNGSLARALEKYDNGGFDSTAELNCIKAAKAALSGEKKVTYKGKTYNMGSFLSFSGRVSNYRLQIADHQFK